MKRIVVVFLMMSVIALAGEAFGVDIKYAGSVTVLEGLMKDAAPAFEKKTGIKIGLSGGGTGAGVKAILSGTIDMAGVSRDLKDDEVKQGLKEYPFGWGAVGLIVNKDIPIDELTSKQAKDILTGKVKNWKAVGGPDKAIKVVISTPGCACREEFQELVMDKEPYAGDAIVSPMKTLSDTIKNTPGSIGPLATAVIDPNKVKVVKLDGSLPTPENVKSKKYKASRRVTLVTKGPATGKVKEFIDFILSTEGQTLVEKNFVKIK